MRSKQVIFVTAAVSLGAAAFAARTAASAQSLDFFFSGLGSSWSRPSYQVPRVDVYAPARRHAHIRYAHYKRKHTHKNFETLTAQSPDPLPRWSEVADRLSAMQKVAPGALNMFLGDTTLKRNDAVMTDTGLLVFKGGAGEKTTRDFVSIVDAKAVKHRADLVAIQKVFVSQFEATRPLKPITTASFEGSQQSAKTFEALEPKAVRHIAGVHSID